MKDNFEAILSLKQKDETDVVVCVGDEFHAVPRNDDRETEKHLEF